MCYGNIENKEIIDIDGHGGHCLAVSKHGTVYGCGYYKQCQLGIDSRKTDKHIKGCNRGFLKDFVKIDSFKGIKVTAAFAGSRHSIFISNQNIAYCVGKNENQLMLYDSDIQITYKPIKIEFTNVTYCIADIVSTIIFIGDCSPKYCPNKKTTDININFI